MVGSFAGKEKLKGLPGKHALIAKTTYIETWLFNYDLPTKALQSKQEPWCAWLKKPSGSLGQVRELTLHLRLYSAGWLEPVLLIMAHKAKIYNGSFKLLAGGTPGPSSNRYPSNAVSSGNFLRKTERSLSSKYIL